jgi:hypothetical protein
MEDPSKIKLTDARTPYLRYLLRKKQKPTDKIDFYEAPEMVKGEGIS